jgi:hypothetical protein
MLGSIIFLIILSSILISFTAMCFVFALKPQAETPITKFNKDKYEACLSINPTEDSDCYVGVVTNDNDIKLNQSEYNSYPMKLYFGDQNDNEGMWNEIEPLLPHDGCSEDDVIQSPFIVNCADDELGEKLINKFYSDLV